MFLSITHKLCAESEADFDVSEAGHAAPEITLAVQDLDSMHSLTRYFVHFRRDRVSAVAGEPIHTRAHQKMGLGRLGRAEQLVDFTLAIADVNTPSRLTEQLRRLLEIFK